MSAMDTSDTSEATTSALAPPVPSVLLWFALLSGVTAWMIHLAGGSALVPAACEHDLAWTIDALTGFTALVCVAGAVAGASVVRRLPSSDDPRSQGYRMLGFVAIVADVTSLVLVLGEGAMHVWIGVCS